MSKLVEIFFKKEHALDEKKEELYRLLEPSLPMIFTLRKPFSKWKYTPGGTFRYCFKTGQLQKQNVSMARRWIYYPTTFISLFKFIKEEYRGLSKIDKVYADTITQLKVIQRG